MNARYYDGSTGRFVSEDPSFLEVGSNALNSLVVGGLTSYITNPQELNSYSYALNNPLTNTDPNGDFSWSNVGLLLTGTANAFLSDSFGGCNRQSSPSTAYKVGQALGDAEAIVAGAGSIAAGAATEVGGSLLDATGVDVIAGVPANVAGVAAIAEGANASTQGILHLSESAGSSNNNSSSFTEKIANGHAMTDHPNDFPEWVNNSNDLKEQLDNIVNSPETEIKDLENGRTAFWDEESKNVVIHDPNNPDQGTAFKPSAGKSYFDKLK